MGSRKKCHLLRVRGGGWRFRKSSVGGLTLTLQFGERERVPWGNKEFLGNTEGPAVLHDPEFIAIPIYLR